MRVFLIVLFFITALIASSIARSQLRANSPRVPKNILSTHRNVHPYPLSSYRRRIRKDGRKEIELGLEKRSAPPYSKFNYDIDSPKEFENDYQQYEQDQIQERNQDLQRFDRGLGKQKQEQEQEQYQNQNKYYQQEGQQQLPVIQWHYADKNMDQEEDDLNQIQEQEIPEIQWNYADQNQAHVQERTKDYDDVQNQGIEIPQNHWQYADQKQNKNEGNDQVRVQQRGVSQNQWNQVDQNENQNNDLNQIQQQDVSQNQWNQFNQNEDQSNDLNQIQQQDVSQNQWDQVDQNEDQSNDLDQIEQQDGNRIRWQYADLDKDKNDNLNQVQQYEQYPDSSKYKNQGQEYDQSQNEFPHSWQIGNQVEDKDDGYESQSEWQKPEELNSQKKYKQAQIEEDTPEWTYNQELNQYKEDDVKPFFPK